MISSRKKITILVLISVTAVSFVGLQFNEIIAETIGITNYTFAENVKITAVFEFKVGTEVTEAQIFVQRRGFNIDSKPVFKLVKVIGNTPLLYSVTDETQKYRKAAYLTFPTHLEFDVKILLASDGEVLRSFAYEDCKVVKYKVDTESDKEEGYISKSMGFAVVDEFTFRCDSYEPLNPQLKTMAEPSKAKTFSSKDYQELQGKNKIQP